jgi:hypothetical protein
LARNVVRDRLRHVDDVNHEREAELVRGLESQAEGGRWIVSAHLIAEPDLDPDDE